MPVSRVQEFGSRWRAASRGAPRLAFQPAQIRKGWQRFSVQTSKCGCPAGHRECLGVEDTRVATAISVSWPKRNQRVRKGADAMNRPSSLRHHHLMQTVIFTPPSADRLVIGLTNVYGNSFVKSPSHGVSKGHTFRQLAPSPSL